MLSKCEHILKEAASKAVEASDDADSPGTRNFALALAADIYEDSGAVSGRDKAAAYLTALMDSDKIRLKAYRSSEGTVCKALRGYVSYRIVSYRIIL